MEYDFEPLNIKNKIINNNVIINKKNKKNNKDVINYDKTTLETYRMKRIYKIDPLNDKKLSDDFIFEFKEKWNPYTGERLENDEIGPLCFDPYDLYLYYYKNRCSGLWYNGNFEYQGYYGELVGTGKDINIKSRGFKPERYLFRLPILDCYLPDNHNYSLITYGPLLNDDEIEYIDKLIILYNKPSLKLIKKYYDAALDSNPDDELLKPIRLKYPDKSDIDIKEIYNRTFVDKLRYL